MGESAHFYCQATGIPVPEILWYRTGKQIRDDHKFIIQSNQFDDCSDSTLIIVDVKQADTGPYNALAVNESGKALCEGELEGR